MKKILPVFIVLIFATATTQAQSYAAQWTNVTGAAVSGTALYKTTTSFGWGASGASSSNTLPSGTDGWVEIQLGTVGPAYYFALGLTPSFTNTNYTSINFGFMVSSSLISVYESGTKRVDLSGGISSYETIRVERVGTSIIYKRNGTIVYTSTLTSSTQLVADISLYAGSVSVSNVNCSFAATGESANPVVSNNAFWVNATGASSSGSILTKSAASGWGNGGASTLNTLNPNTDGWAQFTIDNTTQQRAFGLSRSDVDANYTSIDYAFLLNGTSASVMLAGTSQSTFTVSSGDVLRVERIGTSIYFKQNGTIVYTLTNCYTNSLIGDASIYDNGGTIANAQTSFWIPFQQGLVPDQLEFNVLKIMYDSLGGSAWTTKTNWPAAGSWPSSATSSQFATWYGITVVNADVNKINLISNNLTGAFPGSITKLTALTVLMMYSNHITGHLPSSIGSLSNLVDLYLMANNLSGSIPPSIANLSKLDRLYIYSNSFTGTIPDLSSIQSLYQISIGTNPYTAGPVPSWLQNLPNLNYLEMSACNRTGSLPDLSNLAKLTVFYLPTNQLTGNIPSYIGTFTSLTTLALNNNQFSGAIPSLSNLVNVTSLNIAYNTGLTGDLPDLSNLTKLQSFYCDNDTGLSGPVPSWLGNTTALTTLGMSNCGRSGSIPVSIGNLANATSIVIANNHITGPIPATFGDVVKLQTLDLHSNSITGQLPNSLGNLTSLVTLSLWGNQLSGVIPPTLGNLGNLVTLDVSSNQLSGPIPSELGNLAKLTSLNLQTNQLTGMLPSSLGNLTKLQSMYVATNQLSGAIPSSLMSLPVVTYLTFASNNFTAIPDFSTQVNKANLTLYLTSNQLDFTQLEQLELTSSTESRWAHPTNVTVTTGTVTKTAGSNTAYDAGIISADLLPVSQNGYVQTTIGSTPSSDINSSRAIGLSSVWYGYNYTNITYAIVLQAGGTMQAYESGVAKGTAGTYTSGDVLKVERIGSTIYYKKNETIFYTSTAASTTSLMIHMAFQDLSGRLTNVLSNFVNSGVSSVNYNPQKNIHDITSINVMAGSRLQIAARPLTATTTIVWERQSGPTTWVNMSSTNEDATGATYLVSSAVMSTAGVYHYKMTDSKLPGVLLTADPITVSLTDAPHAQSSGGPATPRYNGTITAASWHTQAAYATGNDDYKGLYLYNYDDKYQLQEAQFAVPDFTSDVFVLDNNNNREVGYTYDPNGNILSLKRYDGTGNKIHDLNYNYDAGKNTVRTVTNSLGAFRIYDYSPVGQMTMQDNATGADQYVDYDVTGKVTCVYSDAAHSTKVTAYTYDDRGFRLSKVTYSGGAPQFTTWYIHDASGNIIYVYNQNANDANLALEEIPLYGSNRLGLYRPKTAGGAEYVYELNDHLGNVRATTKIDQTVYLATMEDNGAADYTNPRVSELQYFTNLFETQQHDTRMNHTLSSTAVPPPNYIAVQTPANTSYLKWTSSDANKKIIGVGITLKVEAGDKLNLEAWAKYQNNATYTRDATTALMAGLLTSAFIGANGLELLPVANQDFTSAIPTMLASSGSDPGTRPYAYLNYIVFDQNFVMMDGGATRVLSTSGFDVGMETTPMQLVTFANPITVNQSGYIYVWVSNESANTSVWWDDLKVTHNGIRVTQATDYYAFGGVMRSQSVSTEPEYRFGYQGKYSEKDDETGWNNFAVRNFDPIIGRWLTPSHARESWSPYWGMGNNPIRFTDANGDGNAGPQVNGESTMNAESSGSIESAAMKSSMRIVAYRAEDRKSGATINSADNPKGTSAQIGLIPNLTADLVTNNFVKFYGAKPVILGYADFADEITKGIDKQFHDHIEKLIDLSDAVNDRSKEEEPKEKPKEKPEENE